MDKNSRIFIAGHTGMVGSAIVRLLLKQGYRNLLLVKHADLDLRGGKSVLTYFRESRPEYVFMCAATVGGIQANIDRPADFLFDNLAIQLSVIQAAKEAGVLKLLFLGSSCMYPRDCPQPMKEEYLLTGLPEPTNRAYAIAKIAGMELCQAYRRQHGCNFITAIPCNIYGPGDNYGEDAHVIPALIKRFNDARLVSVPSVKVWGGGEARREFMHVDDLAEACVFLMERYDKPEAINVGTGEDISIQELADTIAAFIAYKETHPEPVFDPSAPEGTPQKLLDVSRLTALGWKAKIALSDGLWWAIDAYRTYKGTRQ